MITIRTPKVSGLVNSSRFQSLSEPELLDCRLAGVEAGRDDANGGEHGDPAVVQLPGTHLLRVVVPPRERVAEVARLLARVLHEDGRLQAANDRQGREEAHLAVADGACGDVLRHTLHAGDLHKALRQHAQRTHHRQTAVLELLRTEVLELLLVLAEPERVEEPKRRLGAELSLLVEVPRDVRCPPSTLAAAAPGSGHGAAHCHGSACRSHSKSSGLHSKLARARL